MSNLKYEPVRHHHEAFLASAALRSGFAAAYASLGPAYSLASQLLRAPAQAGLTQDDPAAPACGPANLSDSPAPPATNP